MSASAVVPPSTCPRCGAPLECCAQAKSTPPQERKRGALKRRARAAEAFAQRSEAPRRCAAPRIRCYAWPLVGLPFCRAHDPQSRAERQAEREALAAQLGRVRALVREAGPDVSRARA
jgi:hypothetical protein